MKAYKTTDKSVMCRGHQYEIGETYKYEGEIEICKSGFHACRDPMDCTRYYNICEARFFEVEMGGEIIHGGDKSVCSEITIVRELTLSEYIKECIKYKNATKPDVDVDGPEYQNISDDIELERAGGVTAHDRIEVQPWIEKEGRFSWAISDPKALDLACFKHLAKGE